MKNYYDRTLNRTRVLSSTLWHGPNDLINYVGYVGRKNFGDDLLLDIYQKVSGLPVRPILDTFSAQFPIQGKTVLGGGTLIGGPIYESALRRCTSLPHNVFCAGVIPGTIDDTWGELLSEARVFTRSDESADRLKRFKLDVEPFVDPAIFTRELFSITLKNSQNCVIFALHGEYPYEKLYLELFNQLTLHEREELIWLASSPVDLIVCNKMARRLGGTVLCGWKSIADTVTAVASSKFVVSTRLHAGVCAASYRRPFRLVSYDAKHREFLGSISCLRLELRPEDLSKTLISELRHGESIDWGHLDKWTDRKKELLLAFSETEAKRA